MLQTDRKSKNMALLSGHLTFDVSHHPQAQSEVAKSMISRLELDMKTFADRENTASEPRLLFLLDSDCEELVTDPMGAKMAEAEKTLKAIVDSLFVAAAK